MLLALVAAPLWAGEHDWPALYDVIDVDQGDTLNVRAGPGTSHPVIGTFHPGETGIEVMRPSDEGTWGRVNTGERAGWVSLAYLARQPGQWLSGQPRVATCFGTEPFWTLDRTGEGLELKSQGEPGAIVFPIAAETRSRNRIDRFAIVGAGTGGVPGLSVTIARGACSDGMSDRGYGFSAELLSWTGDGYELRSGCCSLAR